MYVSGSQRQEEGGRRRKREEDGGRERKRERQGERGWKREEEEGRGRKREEEGGRVTPLHPNKSCINWLQSPELYSVVSHAFFILRLLLMWLSILGAMACAHFTTLHSVNTNPLLSFITMHTTAMHQNTLYILLCTTPNCTVLHSASLFPCDPTYNIYL